MEFSKIKEEIRDLINTNYLENTKLINYLNLEQMKILKKTYKHVLSGKTIEKSYEDIKLPEITFKNIPLKYVEREFFVQTFENVTQKKDISDDFYYLSSEYNEMNITKIENWLTLKTKLKSNFKDVTKKIGSDYPENIGLFREIRDYFLTNNYYFQAVSSLIPEDRIFNNELNEFVKIYHDLKLIIDVSIKSINFVWVSWDKKLYVDFTLKFERELSNFNAWRQLFYPLDKKGLDIINTKRLLGDYKDYAELLTWDPIYYHGKKQYDLVGDQFVFVGGGREEKISPTITERIADPIRLTAKFKETSEVFIKLDIYFSPLIVREVYFQEYLAGFLPSMNRTKKIDYRNAVTDLKKNKVPKLFGDTAFRLIPFLHREGIILISDREYSLDSYTETITKENHPLCPFNIETTPLNWKILTDDPLSEKTHLQKLDFFLKHLDLTGLNIMNGEELQPLKVRFFDILKVLTESKIEKIFKILIILKKKITQLKNELENGKLKPFVLMEEIFNFMKSNFTESFEYIGHIICQNFFSLLGMTLFDRLSKHNEFVKDINQDIVGGTTLVLMSDLGNFQKSEKISTSDFWAQVDERKFYNVDDEFLKDEFPRVKISYKRTGLENFFLRFKKSKEESENLNPVESTFTSNFEVFSISESFISRSIPIEYFYYFKQPHFGQNKNGISKIELSLGKEKTWDNGPFYLDLGIKMDNLIDKLIGDGFNGEKKIYVEQLQKRMFIIIFESFYDAQQVSEFYQQIQIIPFLSYDHDLSLKFTYDHIYKSLSLISKESETITLNIKSDRKYIIMTCLKIPLDMSFMRRDIYNHFHYIESNWIILKQ